MTIATELSLGMLPTVLVIGVVLLAWSQRNRILDAIQMIQDKWVMRQSDIKRAKQHHPSYPFGHGHVGACECYPQPKFYDQDEHPWG